MVLLPVCMKYDTVNSTTARSWKAEGGRKKAKGKRQQQY
jgi:hypothetical protein